MWTFLVVLFLVFAQVIHSLVIEEKGFADRTGTHVLLIVSRAMFSVGLLKRGLLIPLLMRKSESK
jgi:di/tricarboxylate transporter